MSARREKRLRKLEARVTNLERIAATPAYILHTGEGEPAPAGYFLHPDRPGDDEADYWRKRAFQAEFAAMDAAKPKRKSLFQRIADIFRKDR